MSVEATDSLAVKWRPRWLDSFVGSGAGVKAISNQLASGKVRRTIMITGPVGTGKTSLARIIAQSLLCQNPGNDGRPCFKCQSCATFKHNGVFGNPDYVEENMAVESGVDHTRDLIRISKAHPMLGRYRVFVLDEAQKLSDAAKQALLKAAEEPAAKSVIIICSMSRELFSDKTGKAIISRSLNVEMERPSEDEVVTRLREIALAEGAKNISESLLKAIAARCDCMMRDSISTLDLAISSGVKNLPEDQIDAFVSKLAGKSPFEIAKQALIAIYRRDLKSLIEALPASTDANRLIKMMIEHNANVLRFRHAPQTIENKFAAWSARDINKEARFSDAAIAKVGQRLQEINTSAANYSINGADALIHFGASFARPETNVPARTTSRR